MSKSLNHYASRIAHTIGQPNNQTLKERAKDLIKDYYAKYIIQSIDKNGISNNYKTSLKLDVLPVDATAIIDENYNIWGHIEGGVWIRSINDDTNPNRVKNPFYKIYTEYKTITKVPKPMNIKNDAPFTKVGVIGTARSFTYCSEISYRLADYSSPTRSPRVYQYKDDFIYVKHKSPLGSAVIVEPPTRIEVEGLWENPEEVIGFYSNTDNQDLDLPFPNEMMQFIVADILKTEFNIQPKDVEITN